MEKTVEEYVKTMEECLRKAGMIHGREERGRADSIKDRILAIEEKLDKKFVSVEEQEENR